MPKKMNPVERRSVLVLSTIMALRMLGLFMVLPLFALYASHLPGATPILIGCSMGIYGLTQAILQIPFGALSDHVGRKKIITSGLVIFIIGSIIAALSHSIWGLILGRALQGAGAVGSTIIALIADLTRENQRTKAMAISGMTIGMSFSVAMLLGPVFSTWIQINGIFWLAAIFSFIAIILLFAFIPEPPKPSWHVESEPNMHQLFSLLKHPELMRLNMGIFLLHAIFTASFVVIPIALQTLANLHGNQQWYLYLPVLLLAFFLTIPCILYAEKKTLCETLFHWRRSPIRYR